MDDETRRLRDIFVDVAGEETVTERQQDDRGSLADADEETVRRRLRSLVADLQDHHDFETDLSVETYCTLIRGFYDGADDADLADRLGVPERTAVDARLDCHLVREDDDPLPAEVDLDRDDETLADEHDCSPDAVARHRRAVAAQTASQQASRRFRDAFEELLTDADLATSMTDEVKQDGLDEAAEDIETDVSF